MGTVIEIVLTAAVILVFGSLVFRVCAEIMYGMFR